MKIEGKRFQPFICPEPIWPWPPCPFNFFSRPLPSPGLAAAQKSEGAAHFAETLPGLKPSNSSSAIGSPSSHISQAVESAASPSTHSGRLKVSSTDENVTQREQAHHVHTAIPIHYTCSPLVVRTHFHGV